MLPKERRGKLQIELSAELIWGTFQQGTLTILGLRVRPDQEFTFFGEKGEFS